MLGWCEVSDPKKEREYTLRLQRLFAGQEKIRRDVCHQRLGKDASKVLDYGTQQNLIREVRGHGQKCHTPTTEGLKTFSQVLTDEAIEPESPPTRGSYYCSTPGEPLSEVPSGNGHVATIEATIETQPPPLQGHRICCGGVTPSLSENTNGHGPVDSVKTPPLGPVYSRTMDEIESSLKVNRARLVVAIETRQYQENRQRQLLRALAACEQELYKAREQERQLRIGVRRQERRLTELEEQVRPI